MSFPIIIATGNTFVPTKRGRAIERRGEGRKNNARVETSRRRYSGITRRSPGFVRWHCVTRDLKTRCFVSRPAAQKAVPAQQRSPRHAVDNHGERKRVPQEIYPLLPPLPSPSSLRFYLFHFICFPLRGSPPSRFRARAVRRGAHKTFPPVRCHLLIPPFSQRQ